MIRQYARRLAALSCVLAVLLLVVAAPVRADGLFQPLDGAQALDAARLGAPHLAERRAREVALDPDYLAARIAPPGHDAFENRLDQVPPAATVRIELFDGLVLDFERTGISGAYGGGYIWTGEAGGPVPAWADLVIVDGRVTGHISVLGDPPRNYRIAPLAQGQLHRITELDGSRFPRRGHNHDHDHDHGHDHVHEHEHGHDLDRTRDHGHRHGHTDSPPGHRAAGPEVADAPPLHDSMPESTNTTIDVMIVYTSAAASLVADIRAEANLAVSLANTAFQQSDVRIRYRLVHLHRATGYNEPSNMRTVLQDLTDGVAGPFRTVHELREATGADLVAMLVENDRLCGVAWRPDPPTSATSGDGFSVTAIDCIAVYAFAHELGHNLGLRHDRHVEGPTQLSDYNFGYVNLAGRFYTVMAYEDRCLDAGLVCEPINFFSNPSVQYRGRPTGIAAGRAGAADAARWLNEVRNVVANYRPWRPLNNLFVNRFRVFATADNPFFWMGPNDRATAERGQPAIEDPSSTHAIWFSYTPENNGLLAIATCSSFVPTRLAVFTGRAVNRLTEVSASSNACANGRVVSFQAVAGTEYQIGVAGVRNANGMVNLIIRPLWDPRTTTTLAGPSSAELGDRLTFTATVTSPSGRPRGDVSFRRNDVEFARAALSGSGRASVSTTSLPLGTHEITARFLGSPTASFRASTSAARSLTIRPRPVPTFTSLSAPLTGTVGTPVTFTAIVGAGSGTATGTVSFRRDDIEFATATLDASARASVTTASLPEGTHRITAHFLGNDRFRPSTSTARSVTIRPPTLATTTVLEGPSSGQFGEELAFRATVSSATQTPSGTVEFRRDGTPFAALPLDSGGSAGVAAADLPAGRHAITAHFRGSAGFLPSESPTLAVEIAPAETTTEVAGATSGSFGETLVFTVTVASALVTPAGTVELLRNGDVVATATLDAAGVASVATGDLPVGRSRIAARFAGGADFVESRSEAQVVRVTRAGTETALAGPDTGAFGAPLTFTATVTSGGGVPGGTVAFRRNGEAFATVPVDADGQASATTAELPTGRSRITAQYISDGNFARSVSPVLAVTVDRIETQTTLSGPAGGTVGEALTFAATVAADGPIPAGPVRFLRNGTPFATAMLDGAGVARVTTGDLPLGRSRIRAEYRGAGDFAGSSSAVQRVTVTRAETTTTLAGPSTGLPGQPLRLDATVQADGDPPEGAVRFLRNGSPFATAPLDAAGAASVLVDDLPTGRSRIVAQYTGGPRHARSRSGVLAVVVAPPATGMMQVAAGVAHSCGLGDDGTVRCWGANGLGQLGDGTRLRRLAPAPVPDLAGVTQIAAGERHTCALRDTGGVLCWGSNGFGQLGDGATAGSRPVPAAVAGLAGIVAIAAGRHHSCALHKDGDVLCWGRNLRGQIGDGTLDTRPEPTQVTGLAPATGIAAGGMHSCAITEAGAAWCWGGNGAGQLGDGSRRHRAAPVEVAGLTGAAGIAAGAQHSCAVTAAGAAFCWGNNGQGQLGDGTREPRRTATQVPGLAGAAGITAGATHSCAFREAGPAHCWGANASGQLGDGSALRRLLPAAVDGLAAVTQMAAGVAHACAVTAPGAAFCWGANEAGQLGDGTTTERPSPVPLR